MSGRFQVGFVSHGATEVYAMSSGKSLSACAPAGPSVEHRAGAWTAHRRP